MSNEYEYLIKKIEDVDRKLDTMFEKYDILHTNHIRHDEKINLVWRVFILTPVTIVMGFIINYFLK